MQTQKPRLIGYVRYSPRPSSGELTIATQRAQIQSYCDFHGCELIDVFEDTQQSAKSLARPGLQGALQALEDGRAEGLVIAKLDRLTRSVADLDSLVKRYFAKRFTLSSKVDHIDTRSAAGRMILNLL